MRLTPSSSSCCGFCLLLPHTSEISFTEQASYLPRNCPHPFSHSSAPAQSWGKPNTLRASSLWGREERQKAESWWLLPVHHSLGDTLYEDCCLSFEAPQIRNSTGWSEYVPLTSTFLEAPTRKMPRRTLLHRLIKEDKDRNSLSVELRDNKAPRRELINC